MDGFGEAAFGFVWASAAVIFVSTLVFLYSRHWGQTKISYEALEALYNDEDGVSTEDSMSRYSVWAQKFLIAFASVVGFVASLFGAIRLTIASNISISDTLQRWAFVLSWLPFFALSVILQLERRPLAVFSQASRIFVLSSILLVAQVVFTIAQSNGQYTTRSVDVWISGMQGVATIIMLLSASFVPRRPEVYFNGRLVDGMRTSSIFSRYTLHWGGYILAKAAKKGHFEEEDVPVLDRHRRSESLLDGFSRLEKTPKLYWQIFLAHKKAFVFQWIWSAIGALATCSPPVFMNKVLDYLERRDSGQVVREYEGWLWVAGLGLGKLMEALIGAYVYWVCFAGLQIPIQSQLAAAVFSKTMRKKDVKGMQKVDKPSENPEQAEGSKPTPPDEDEDEDELKNMKQGTINLIAVDAGRVADMASFSNMFIVALFEAIFGLTVVVRILGWQSPLAGLSAVLFTTPINSYFSKLYSAAQDDLMKIRDRKMAVVSEALQGVRQIKFSAEEARWEERIRKVRSDELKALRRVFMADVAVISAWIMTPVFLSAVSLSVYATINGELTASVAFPALAMFSELEFTFSVVPELITDIFDALVSVRRIKQYLDSPEKKQILKESSRIAIIDATIAWAADTEDEKDRFCLRNINLEFPMHELSIISGRTGSGKSLLLASLLGEADLLAGSVEMPRVPGPEERFDSKATTGNWILPTAVAFVAQSPWMENGSIKDNIVFGLPFDRKRYQKTLDSCALEKDLEILPDGDMTQIGANGINLSGGQRWRVSFARAMYSRAGILILDDIFSAVDAHVGKYIFENGLTGELMRGRTRILVSHHLKLCLPKAKYAVSLTNGAIDSAGTVEELRERGILSTLIEKEDRVDTTDDEEPEEVNYELTKVTTKDTIASHRRPSISEGKKPREFITEEERERGSVKWAIYTAYMKASGGAWFWLLLIGLFVLQEANVLGRNYWVKIWTSDRETEGVRLRTLYQYSLQNLSAAAQNSKSVAFYIGIYILISVFSVLVGTARYACIFTASLKASRQLFNKMTWVILRAPLRWLDTVPAGRILNRFSKDFETLDSRVANDIAFLLHNSLGVISVNATAIYLSPWVVGIALLFLVIDVRYALYYLTGGREAKRLESVSRSPIFELFGSALNGVETIRAFGKAQEYTKKMFSRIDVNAQRTFYMWLFNRWVSLRLSAVGSIFMIVMGAFIVKYRGIDASLAGFVLSFTVTYGSYVLWTLRRYANTELSMNSAERIVEYMNIPTEDQGGISPPAAWPYEGRIEVDGLTVSYAPDLPPVLKGISFQVKPRERVGIVGRTGAGKSSLTLALFQFIRASSGTIYIDGLDVSKLNLYDLRSRLAIIPQDPVLFSGTVRSNLDAFNEYSDKDLKDALARVHLVTGSSSDGSPSSSSSSATEGNTNIFESLDSRISEGGSNLSQGQKQLVCLARAIISRPKILVLDEATSAVDMQTDALIQQSIREEFTDCTTLVIAHRLQTVASYDKILVLGDGKVLEYDSPWNLIQSRGAFYEMVQQSGEGELLEKIAKTSAT